MRLRQHRGRLCIDIEPELRKGISLPGARLHVSIRDYVENLGRTVLSFEVSESNGARRLHSGQPGSVRESAENRAISRGKRKPCRVVSTGLRNPYGVAVDGHGNVYIADTYNNAIKKYSL